MTKNLMIILLIISQTAYSQKTRRSDSKAEKERTNRALRADIFGECYEDYYVYKDDGTIDTVYAPNWKRPDCFGMQSKKPVYRKTSKRKTPSQGKNRMKPTKNRTDMLMKAMAVKNLQLIPESFTLVCMAANMNSGQLSMLLILILPSRQSIDPVL
jgi:hypothetical protein